MKVFCVVTDCRMIPRTAETINRNYSVNKNLAMSLSELTQADDDFSFN